MARIQVKAKASLDELKFVGQNGDAVIAIHPTEVFSVGSSIGGYIALPVEGTGGHRWSLIRISGSEKDAFARASKSDRLVTVNGLTMEERKLLPVFNREPEKVAVDGRQYLLATTAGSARRGVIHVYRRPEDERDPIRRVLIEARLGGSILERIDGGPIEADSRWYDQRHCPVGRPTWWWVTDGEVEETSSVTNEEPHGFFEGGGQSSLRIKDGSYAIRAYYSRSLNGSEQVAVTRVLVRSACDPNALKKALAEAVR